MENKEVKNKALNSIMEDLLKDHSNKDLKIDDVSFLN